jgi:predicted lipid-binding transport protein (Tim44 family)
MSPPRLNARARPLAALAIVTADAAVGRVGGGKSFGSRGTKTHTVPTATKTAKHSAPIKDSMTDRRNHAAASAQPSRPRGLSGLLLGELIRVVNAIRTRKQPAFASAPGTGDTRRDTPNRSSYTFRDGPTAPALPLSIGKEEFDCFERLLGEIQTAYGREDTEELGARTTPEMFSHFSQDLYDNANQRLRNNVSDIKLLQGDLSEAWHESGSDYATVAMRYSLVHAGVDRATGTLISGDLAQRSEVTELWTFRRDDRARADGWELSAIQQAA